MTELSFSSDTKHRKQFFTGMSFSHPAKMVLPLQLWLIENYLDGLQGDFIKVRGQELHVTRKVSWKSVPVK